MGYNDDMTKDFNPKGYYLMIYDGVTESYGVGMGDMGGYPIRKIQLIGKGSLESYTNKLKDGARLFEFTEVELPSDEYIQYLELKKKFGGI